MCDSFQNIQRAHVLHGLKPFVGLHENLWHDQHVLCGCLLTEPQKPTELMPMPLALSELRGTMSIQFLVS